METQKYKVRSKSEPGKFHLVEISEDGTIVCSRETGKFDGVEFVECIPGYYNKPCWHKTLIEKHVKKNREKLSGE